MENPDSFAQSECASRPSYDQIVRWIAILHSPGVTQVCTEEEIRQAKRATAAASGVYSLETRAPGLRVPWKRAPPPIVHLGNVHADVWEVISHQKQRARDRDLNGTSPLEMIQPDPALGLLGTIYVDLWNATAYQRWMTAIRGKTLPLYRPTGPSPLPTPEPNPPSWFTETTRPDPIMTPQQYKTYIIQTLQGMVEIRLMMAVTMHPRWTDFVELDHVRGKIYYHRSIHPPEDWLAKHGHLNHREIMPYVPMEGWMWYEEVWESQAPLPTS